MSRMNTSLAPERLVIHIWHSVVISHWSMSEEYEHSTSRK
jgi:hypothetical protein